MRQEQTTRNEMQVVQHHSQTTCLIYIPHGQINVPTDVMVRLDEWARWARPRLNLDPHGRCASAEGRFESESDNERGIDGMADNLPVDLQSVLAVERVVCTRLPPVPREIVRRHFVLRNLPKEIARALGIHAYRYGDELKRSILMVRNRLTMI